MKVLVVSISIGVLIGAASLALAQQSPPATETVTIGGKVLLIKTGEQFRIFALSASRRIDSQAIKTYFQVRKTRFATPEELMELTGLQPGAVPPLGRLLPPFDLYVDTSILTNDRIAFNVGSLTDSILVSVNDYLRVAKPIIFRFSL
jgi:Ala-tRNA(Pro) deacylase